MSWQKTLFFSNTRIYVFIKEENPLSVVPQYFVKMETKNWKSVYINIYIFFELVDKFPIGQMHIGLLFVQRNVFTKKKKILVCKNDGEASLG